MITEFKIFERIEKYAEDLDIGYGINDGILGILINHEEYKEMDPLLLYLKDKDIKYNLYITDRIVLMVFAGYDDIKKLPKPISLHKFDITDHYVPFISQTGRSLGWFYKDIFDEDSWEEVFIDNQNDVKELIEKMKIYSETNKYNI